MHRRGEDGADGHAAVLRIRALLARLARILGKSEEAEDYTRMAKQIKTAYQDRFVSPGTGVVASGIQSVQAFALALDMLPETERAAALRQLVRDIDEKHEGHLSTGIFGTKYMLEVLSREGRVETAYRVVNQRDFPGWGHMLEQAPPRCGSTGNSATTPSVTIILCSARSANGSTIGWAGSSRLLRRWALIASCCTLASSRGWIG